MEYFHLLFSLPLFSNRSLSGRRWQIANDSAVSLSDFVRSKKREEIGLDRLVPLALPELFPMAKKAAERMQRALETKEHIGIFGDYDCDGVCGAAILVRMCQAHGLKPTVRLPHRENEGYGLSLGHIEEMKQAGVTLLLTVDTGITARAPIAAAKAAGIETIVLDHHSVPQMLPEAFAILHPALAPLYPLPHPSGAAVALSFREAVEGETWEHMDEDIALAAIATIADLVPLHGWNRALVKRGIQILEQIESGPLFLLCESVRRNAPLTSRDIAFRIAPRLNAAGRMADPSIALAAVLGEPSALAELHRLNMDRQHLTAELFEEILIRARAKSDRAFLLEIDEEYPAGVVGLLAGKLTDVFGKPSLVAQKSGELCRASLRSPSYYNVMEGLRTCSDLLQNFGGHAQAAGCTFAFKDAEALGERLSAHVQSTVTEEMLMPLLTIDAILLHEHIRLEHVAELSVLEPFGQGNPEPIFLLSGVRLDHMRRVGADGSHLAASIHGIAAIGFRMGGLAEHAKDTVDIACRLTVEQWNGRTFPKIMMEDMRVAVTEPMKV